MKMVIILYLENSIQKEFTYKKKEQNKTKVKHQYPKKYKLTFIHIAEMFITNVALDKNFCMDLNEYQSVVAAAI